MKEKIQRNMEREAALGRIKFTKSYVSGLEGKLNLKMVAG